MLAMIETKTTSYLKHNLDKIWKDVPKELLAVNSIDKDYKVRMETPITEEEYIL